MNKPSPFLQCGHAQQYWVAEKEHCALCELSARDNIIHDLTLKLARAEASEIQLQSQLQTLRSDMEQYIKSARGQMEKALLGLYVTEKVEAIT